MAKVSITEGPEDPQSFMDLFEAHKKVYPAKVKGFFRKLKWSLLVLFLSIYYALPLARWERGLGAPDQAVLIDVSERKFYFFFIEVWPQEVYYFTAILLCAALGLFFITSLLGRVWCGYACPQTVWTDLFILVERWVEGDRLKRLKLDQAPWTFSKLFKKAFKHSLWILIGICTGGALVLYFQDAPTFFNNLLELNIGGASLFWICFLTLSTYIMAGFAREHVCTYMCPYARFQGAMFDDHSLIVSYDEKRGEPRGKAGSTEGDCVDCGRCVAVCPTGIDIRNGQQYQCINCALCVDACNAIMAKLKRPLGLIRYNTFHNEVPANVGFKFFKYVNILRPRIIGYVTVLVLVGTVTLYNLINRPLMDLNIVRDRNPLFIPLADGSIRNAYTIRLVNKTWSPQTYTLTTPDVPDALLSTAQQKNNDGHKLELSVKPGKVGSFRVLVDRPYQTGQTNITFKAATDAFENSYVSRFVFPTEDGF